MTMDNGDFDEMQELMSEAPDAPEYVGATLSDLDIPMPEKIRYEQWYRRQMGFPVFSRELYRKGHRERHEQLYMSATREMDIGGRHLPAQEARHITVSTQFITPLAYLDTVSDEELLKLRLISPNKIRVLREALANRPVE